MIDPAACAAHFRVDSQTWVTVLIRAATYFSHLAPARYDPSERRAKQRRLMDAGEQVRAGRLRPERAGIPGVGVPPPSSYRSDWWNTDPPTDIDRSRVMA